MAITTTTIPQTLWATQIPLYITHASSSTGASSKPPFLATIPRFSYLSQLLPRLRLYFAPLECTSFTFDDVPLRNLPAGLLLDLYRPALSSLTATSLDAPAAPSSPKAASSAGASRRDDPSKRRHPDDEPGAPAAAGATTQPSPLPWRLVVGDGPDWDTADTFLNSVKEAAYLRDGTAKYIMSLSTDDTAQLWNAVRDNDYASHAKVYDRLLGTPVALRHIPLRVYIPSSVPRAGSPPPDATQGGGGVRGGAGRMSSPARGPKKAGANAEAAEPAPAGTYKVVQSLVPPHPSNSRQPMLLGAALRSLLPSLFPSSRDPVLANVILHGAAVPFSAPVEDLMREAAYPDGWLCLVVVLL